MYTRLRLSIHLLDIEWSLPFAVVNGQVVDKFLSLWFQFFCADV